MLAINSSTPPRRYIISPPFTASPDPPTLLKERGNLRMSDPEQEQSNIRRSLVPPTSTRSQTTCPMSI